MNCPGCGHENRAGRKYCAACGTALAERCPACAARFEPGERFCGECGATLPAPAAAPPPPPRPQRDPAAPEALADGRYELKRFLGEGGRKRVYLARDRSLDRDVAVAIIKTDGLDDTAVTRARREAEAMGRLGDHPHIVTVHDIGEDEGRLYVVSQFMAGGDLDDLMEAAEGRRLPVDRAVDIGIQVCQALEHAHDNDVVHRDIKPKNVWLTADGAARLGDFGLAVSLDRSRITLEGMMVGTVAYMPPEQSMGQPVDARSDIYSLGALLYELVCGRPPFLGDDAVAIISQHIHTAPVAPSWVNEAVPRALDELILKMLSKSPDERPRSAGAVRGALEALASGEAIAAEPIVADRASPLERLAGGLFVGREEETAELRSSLEAILSGRGRVVMVTGEMGIGKTRLAGELGTYASLRGAKVLWGRCYEDAGAPSYWPWVQVVRAYVHDRDPEALSAEMGAGGADIAQVVSEVRARLPGLPVPAATDPDEARFRLFDAVATFLKNAARTSPLVVILDDLQWADRASLLLLRFLASQLRGSRILVLGTFRDTEVDDDHPLMDVLAGLRRERDHRRVALKGLALEEARSLLEASAEHELGGREARIARLMYDRTEGNPFFIEEVIRHLVETGQLNRRDGRWVIGVERVEDIGIPEGIRETIGRRLARLSHECRELLTVASVVGREFDLARLGKLTGEDPPGLLDKLDEAVRARIVAPMSARAGRYRFVHNLTRQTLYDRLPASRRIALHAGVVDALEDLHGTSIESHLPELAHHAAESILVGGADRAVDYAIRAAARASGMLAYEDAVRYYDAALQAAGPESDSRRRLELLLAVGDARWRNGEFDRAREAHRSAARLATGLGLPEQLAAAALGYGGGLGFEAASPDETLLALLSAARRALGDVKTPLQARVTSRLAEALLFSERRAESQDLAREAVQTARSCQDPAALAYTLQRLHWVMWGPDTLPERLEIARETSALAEEAGDTVLQWEAQVFLIGDLLEGGDIAAADGEIARFAAATHALPIPYHVWFLRVIEAMRMLVRGEFEAAGQRALEALTAGQDAQNQSALLAYGAQFALIRRELGMSEGLVEGATGFIEQFPTIPAWRCARAYYHSDAGHDEEAARDVDVLAADGFAGIPRDMFWFTSMTLLSQAVANLGDGERAAAMYDLLAPYADRYSVVAPCATTYGSVERNLGLLAATLGRADDAVRHLRAAVTRNAAIGARGWVAHCQADLGRLLLDRGAPGDQHEALEMLGAALDTARALKMAGLIEEVLALKLEAQGVDVAEPQTSIDAVVASVEAVRPDLRSHAAADGTVTLLFSDIENSTLMTEALGDARWLELLQAHNRIVREEVRAHRGFEVKSQGDGFMLAFSSASRALLCAVGIQRGVRAHGERFPDQSLQVRIGLHTGEAIRAGDDFFGRNVVLAARVAEQARGSEILVSAPLKELVESSARWTFAAAREVELKGLAGRHRVYAIEWQPEVATTAP